MKNIFISILILFLFVSCEQDSASSEDTSDEKAVDGRKEQTVRAVRVLPRSADTVVQDMRYEAKVHAEHDVVLTAKANGEILRHSFAIGDFVKKGQTLVVIDPVLPKNALRQAELQKKQAELSLRLREKTFARDRKLFESKNLSQERFEQSQHALENAELAVEQAVAALAQAQVNVEFTTLAAPFSGEIAETLAFKGQTVSMGTPVARLVDTRRLKVIVGLTDGDLLLFRKNPSREGVIHLPDGGKITGRITGISEAPDRQTSLYTMKIRFRRSPEHTVFPGMYVTVTVPGPSFETAFTVPRTAMIMKKGKYHLFIERDGTARKKSVTLLGRTGGSMVVRFAESGPQQFNLVVSGHRSLTDGQNVKVID